MAKRVKQSEKSLQAKSGKIQMTGSWELVRPSYELIKLHIDQVIAINLIPSLVVALGSIVYVNQSKSLGSTIQFIGGVWLLINLPVAYYLQLAAAKGELPSTRECYQRGLPYFWRLLGFGVLFALLLIGGLILLIVPALIILRRYFLAPFYMIERNLGILSAMDISSKQSKPAAGYIWGTIGVMVTFMMLASILSYVAIFGAILSSVVPLIYLFGPVLRYKEVAASAKPTPRPKRSNGKKPPARRRKNAA